MMEAARDFNAYLQLTTQPNNEMYALANYNLGYIAFHRKDYTQASNYFQKYIQLEKVKTEQRLQMPTTVSETVI